MAREFTKESGEGWIYVLWAEGTDLYKIGFTRRWILSRLEEMQAHSPLALYLFCLKQGTYKDENKWHRRFISKNAHGEWFHLTEIELAELVAWGGLKYDTEEVSLLVQEVALLAGEFYFDEKPRVKMG